MSQLNHHLLHVLQHKVSIMPDHKLLTSVDKDCKEVNTLTYKQLDDASSAIAAMLLEKNCKRGDRVMVAYPIGLDFLAGMLGCMKIGVIPCSIYPPNPKKMRFEMAKFKKFVEDAGAKYALSTGAFSKIMTAAGFVYDSGGVLWMGTDKLLIRKKKYCLEDFDRINPEMEAVAFIQYTSGSTGHPKGVMISHRSLLNNCIEIAAIGDATPSNTGVMWVPQYHDMGLVGGFMTTIYSGVHLVVASPMDFLVNPLLWADMVEKYKADFTCAPNFAFALLLKRLRQAGRTAEWSGVKRAIFGGEPTRMDVVKQLVSDLKMKPENVWNMYGMAECGLCVTAGVAQAGSDGVLASCGPIESAYCKIRIVKRDSMTLAVLGEVGSIFVWSPLAASGYHGKDEATRTTFQNEIDGEEGATWLDTGDLGKVVDGNLFVTGRLKDLIIVNGKNYYPTDIEGAVDSSLGNTIRPGRTSVVQLGDTDVAVTVEVRPGKKTSDQLRNQIKETISQDCGVGVGRVYVLSSGSTPKTTSGKLKRSEIRQLCLDEAWRPTDIIACYRSGTLQAAPTKVPSDLNTSNLPTSLVEAIEPSVDGIHPVDATFQSLLGPNVDLSASWDANGLTSLLHAELIGRMQEFHQVTLPFDFHEKHPTPDLLKQFVESCSSATSQQFQVDTPCLDETRTQRDVHESLSLPALAALQAIGVFFLLLVIAVSVAVSYYAGKLVAEHLSSTFEIGDTERYTAVSWLPVAIPAFFFTFSALVILLKWIVIGRYITCIIDLPSVNYLRWWFIDRLVDLWERWVGRFIIDTKMIWVVYRLLGAKLAFSCDVKSFIREFDLVEVGSNCLIEHQIHCRKFRPWNGTEPPSMVFRQITVQAGCAISGMLGPGVHVGQSSKVERFCAVTEGSRVPANTIAKGSPAFNAGSYAGAQREHGYLLVELCKVIWLLVELYMFFSLFLLAQIALNQQPISNAWRYSPLFYWIQLLVLTSIFGILTSIILKWVWIGRRRPSNGESTSPQQRISRWCCDYHYRIASVTLANLIGTSGVWNLVLFLHGLDIDRASKPIAGTNSLPPSKVDLVRIRRSFVATSVTFDSDDYVEIVDSSVGFNVHIDQGVKIHRSVVPPQFSVQDSLFDANSQADERYRPSCMAQILMELYLLACGVLVCVSFIPSYELFIATVPNALPGIVILWLCLIVIVQCVAWILIEKLLQVILYMSSAPSHRFAVFPSSADISCSNHAWNILLTCFLGTSFIRPFFRFMGARVEGELWYFGSDVYDIPRLTFEDRTIVDDAYITGHYIVFDDLRLANTHIGGVLHPGTACTCGTKLDRRESGPVKIYHGGIKLSLRTEASSLSFDIDE